MIALDRRLELWIVAHRVGALDWFFIGLSRVGNVGLVFLALALGVALIRRSPRIFVLVLAADAAADALAAAGKALIDRHRPFVHQLGPPATSHSFPSGHSATSFACATVLAAVAPRLRAPAFVLAALIAFSRLYNGDHYPLDVLAGSALGAATALLLLAAVRRGQRRALRAG